MTTWNKTKKKTPPISEDYADSSEPLLLFWEDIRELDVGYYDPAYQDVNPQALTNWISCVTGKVYDAPPDYWSEIELPKKGAPA